MSEMFKVKSKRDALNQALIAVVLTQTIGATLVAFFFPPDLWVRLWTFFGIIGAPMAFIGQYTACMQAFENARLAEELNDLVCRDPLTNVATRRFFFERMQMTPRAHGAVLMVDIDHFKSINDTHGHLVGDTAIRTVAQTLTTLCRGQDLVCRFGGEEFVIFIYEVDAETALGMAEILRACIETTPIQHDDIELFATVSLGVAMKQPETDIDKVIDWADVRLYEAKQNGRNRCVLHTLDNTEALTAA